MIKINKIKSIKFSLMKKKTDINKDNKAEYEIYSSVFFNITDEFLNKYINIKDDELINNLIDVLYDDLISKNKINDIEDYLGLWINYDNQLYENAISLLSLNDIKKYSVENINIVYEFVKMTLNLNEIS